MRCGNGEIVVRRWWLGFAISAEIHCVTAVALCVSGVSNHDFPNFTKHSTVLTSILRQINTLYQHFPSAKTALPALEQAKTMLKIALHHVQKRWKPHSKQQNSHSKQRLRGALRRIRWWFPAFLLPKWRNGGAMAAVGCVVAAVSMCYSDDCKVYLRWKYGAEMAKMRFGNGEIVVRRWQNCGVFAACTWLISCIFVANVAKWWCDCGGWWCGCGVFVFGFFMI